MKTFEPPAPKFEQNNASYAMNKRHILFMLYFVGICAIAVSAQEALVSDTERYYDFLALQGAVERPYLNYRTLSDSVWKINSDADHLWKEQNLGITRNLFKDISMRVYGPELFTSVNTAAPYGQNDGALWQGRGFNGSFTAGIRFAGYGVEATFKPQIAFSQNLSFDYITPNYSGADYAGKGDTYGYYGIPSIDAPQRFGSEPFFVYDWGDSEIRYAWKTATIGFGTQAIWLGPAQINPIIHSNNAPTYPKLDIGIRKQRITLPRLNWYLGDIEFRAWWGYLSESNYFDNTSENDHNLITGLAIAYGVPFLPGLSIGLNRIMLSKWEAMAYTSIFTLFVPSMDSSSGYDEQDQRASLTIDYILPTAGFEIYFEWSRNDYSTNIDDTVAYPFHTQAYTFGARKSIIFTKQLQGEILFEITNLESSRDYELWWPTTFYAHHIITQGHTNKGQWLGAGIGTGGNSQYLGFKMYHKKGYTSLFIQRQNNDNDYIWFANFDKSVAVKKTDYYRIKAQISISIDNFITVYKHFGIFTNFVYTEIFNPLYDGVPPNVGRYARDRNFHISTGVKLKF
jgi:hypothetical protein